MRAEDLLILSVATLLYGGCSSGSESSSEPDAPPANTSPSPASAGPGATASGTQFSPLKGGAKAVADGAQAEADAALAAACACSGVGSCAGAGFDWAVVQLSECYYEAFDNNPAAVEGVQTCVGESLDAIEMQYSAQEVCGEAGLIFAQLQISEVLRGCGLMQSTLGPILNDCDGAPTGP